MHKKVIRELDLTKFLQQQKMFMFALLSSLISRQMILIRKMGEPIFLESNKNLYEDRERQSDDGTDSDDPFCLQTKLPDTQINLHVSRLLRSKDTVGQKLA